MSRTDPRYFTAHERPVAGYACLAKRRVSLDELSRFFKIWHTRRHSPDLLLHAAGKMGVEPGACIVVEDSPVGVTAGVAAGMTVIGFVGASHAGSAPPISCAPPAPAT